MYDVRLRLSKRGRIKFVSHLDMFRTMQRAVRRAEIPLWYTEGFNPHPYISYLLALPLGVEGVSEPIDIRLVEPMSMEELTRRPRACGWRAPRNPSINRRRSLSPGTTCIWTGRISRRRS